MNEMMFGVYVAVVENNTFDDDAKIEITLEHVAGKNKCRARIATLMAGNERGSLFLPEKNDQVLVAFEQGLFEFPVIIGALWSRKDKPPDTNSDGNNDLKLIKTRGGNEIRLTDKDGEEKIEIVNVNQKGESKIIIEKEGNKISIDSPKGTISLSAKSISIIAEEELKISSTKKTIEIEAKGNTTIKGDIVDINPPKVI